MHIGIVAIDGCFSSGLSALLDVINTGEAMRDEVDSSIAPITVDIVGPSRTVTTSIGLVAKPTRSFRDLSDFGVVVVPAPRALSGGQVQDALAHVQCRRLVEALTRADPSTTTFSGACTGAFILAEAGILDDGRATTSWWLGPEFRSRYPKVELDLDAMVVIDDCAITAGAGFAHVDLALALLRRISPMLAERVAHMLVIDERRSQGTYVALDHLHHHDPLVLAFERFTRSHLHEPFEITNVCRQLGTSRRTLERRLRQSVGLTPIAFVQRLRVERAVHLQRTTAQSIDTIAPQVGYANGSTLGALIRRMR
ncbi:MAG: GlxA family transcriptional regulator [Acidimicrobiia bacterium]